MTPFIIALVMSIGVATWVYNKVMERTGGNTQNALIVMAVSGVMVFIFTLITISLVESILVS